MPELDMSLMDRLGKKGRLAGGGGGSDDGGMLDTRVASLEFEMREIKWILVRIDKQLGQIDDRLRRVELDMGGLKGRVSQLPSTWVMVTLGVSMTLTLAGFVLALFRFGLPASP